MNTPWFVALFLHSYKISLQETLLNNLGGGGGNNPAFTLGMNQVIWSLSMWAGFCPWEVAL